MVTGKQAVPVKTRNRRSKVAEPQEDSQNPESSKIKPSSLFKEMNISVSGRCIVVTRVELPFPLSLGIDLDGSPQIEKRRNGKRQELRRHHKLQAKKAEERIREAFRVDKSAL